MSTRILLPRPLAHVRGRLRPLVKVDLTATLLYGLFGGMTFPFFAVIARRLGASPLALSFLVAAPAVGMPLSLLWARLLRRWSAATVLAWSGVLSRGLFLLTPFVRTSAAYIGLIFCFHAVNSATSPAYTQVVGVIYPVEERGRIVGIVRTGMALAWIVASLAGGRLHQSLPFQWVFAVAGLFGIAGSLVYRRLGEAFSLFRGEIEAPRGAFAVVRSDLRFRRFLVPFFLYGTGYWLSAPAVPILLVDVLRATDFQVGLLASTSSLFWLLSYRFWGRVIDRRSAMGTLRWAYTLGLFTPLVYLVAPNVWVLLLAAAIDGVVTAGIDLLWMFAIMEMAPRQEIAAYTALYNTSVGIRGTTMPFLSGFLLQFIPVRAIFGLAMGSILVSIWLARRLRNTLREIS